VATSTLANPEGQFSRGAWLTLFIAIAILIYGFVGLAYRFTLPTDGWEATGGNLPGMVYAKNLMGNPSGLQPGDRVAAVEGIPVFADSPMIQQSWRVGATLDYTVIRGGQEIRVPVTLVQWQFGKWLRATLLDPVKLAGLLSVTILLALAAFIFLRRPGNPAAGAFLIIMVILASLRLSDTLPTDFSRWIDPVANVLQLVNDYILILLLPFALIQLALVFPHPKPIRQRHPWLAYSIGVIGLILVVFVSDNIPIGWFWFVFSLFLAVAILIHNAFTMRDAVSRAQLRWGLGGLIIGFGTLALIFLAGTVELFEINPDIFNLIFIFASMVMGIMLAVAITRYRLFDIDVIIRRTLVYAVVSSLLILAYFGSVVVLQSLFAAGTGESSPIAIVISTLLIAALFSPLRRRVQETIDRRFYRRRYDAQQVLAAFAATARDEVDLDALTAELVRTVQETMQPERVTVWLRDVQTTRSNNVQAADTGD
jgi:hypothetical protein